MLHCRKLTYFPEMDDGSIRLPGGNIMFPGWLVAVYMSVCQVCVPRARENGLRGEPTVPVDIDTVWMSIHMYVCTYQ